MKTEVTKFYASLGVDGLSNLLTEKSNDLYCSFVKSCLVPGNILDVGCGYGRIAIPLINKGYDVEGIDIMEEFVAYANSQTNESRFKKGDILDIPHNNSTFSNVICMWSTFNHFLTIENQEKVLLEIYRVLRPEGICIIDVPTPEIYNLPKLSEVKTSNPKDNLCSYTVNDIPNTDYVHDEASLGALMHLVKIEDYKIERVMIGDLPRLILTFTK